jgi:serine protease Do
MFVSQLRAPSQRPDPSTCATRYTRSVNVCRLHFPALCAGLALLTSAAMSFGGPAAAKPRSPSDSPAPNASAAASAQQPPASPMERAKRGVVVLERSGRPLGLGVVLAGDGRMLTALSVLGDGNGVDARYADGSLVNVRVGHSDRVWDLALLVPQVGRWGEGLSATAGDPIRLGSQIRTFSLVRGRPIVASVVLKGRAAMQGADGELLRDALEISTRVPPTDLGAPMVDEQGQVAGLVARACASSAGQTDAGACHPVAYGAPVEALRQFLRSAPANAIPPAPWLGIQGAAALTQAGRGVRIALVHPESPADDAGLRGGNEATADVIIAVDGTPVQSPEKLAEVVRTRAVGDRVEVIVLRENKLRVVLIVLRAAPATRPTGSGPTGRP